MFSSWPSPLQRTGVSLALLLLGFSASLRAQQINAGSDQALSQAAEQAVRIGHAGANAPDADLRISRRQDLEGLLLSVEKYTPGTSVYFYEMHLPPAANTDPSPLGIAAVMRSEQQVYNLYSFEVSPRAPESSQEFNRLTSALALSVSEDKAVSLARLFVESVADEPGEIVSDEADLRRVVQNYYYALYGDDVWRTLEAYSRWWQDHQADARALAPTVELGSNGNYRVTLHRALTAVGRHPRVQKLDLEICPNGTVSVVGSQPAVPAKPQWLFFDDPDIEPSPLK
jgi:hypothetical protein